MNERIRELMAEVGMSVDYLTNTKQIVLIEKFAELIVAECMRLNSKELSITAIERLLPVYEEHFGVEE